MYHFGNGQVLRPTGLQKCLSVNLYQSHRQLKYSVHKYKFKAATGCH